jgi:hypothetical protein
MNRFAAALALLLLTAGLLGCENADRAEALRHENLVAADGGDPAAADLFHVDVTLYRRYAGTRWLRDKDHEFTIKDESHIKAEVDGRNMRPGRIYSMHLVWISPDGSEIFRRYAEARLLDVMLPAGAAPDSSGALPEDVALGLEEAYGKRAGRDLAERLAAGPDAAAPVVEVVYKKAVDLGYEKPRYAVVDEDRAPHFNLDSRLNISREKQRAPGDYLLRIYLDRRLLREVPFTIGDGS